MTQERRQVPVAIVGLGCRLPGHSESPTALWNLLELGGIASNKPPDSRFNIAGHYDKHRRPRTMKTPGGMFLENVDLEAFDGQFFNISHADCIAMDPQQRQLLEVTYECLENGGITLESLSGKAVGCVIGTNIVDYAAIQNRDPEDRPESATIGVASSILSNRISHFLNIHGPSMTVDTACSASLVAVDVACRYLDSYQADAMIVGGANIWLSPEHNEESGLMRMTQSASGKCHSFDAKADGYVKAEGINCVFLKRLDDALRDRDPIRGIIRGTSTNSAGRTPGIASPSPTAQAAAIRAAYRNAGITDFNGTGFLECHGTGTLAGDPIEVEGAASVFAATRTAECQLIIGSIKSNIGHSEAAAGLSGLIKVTLATEKGVIPGNPTFLDPNPRIDFETSRVRAIGRTIPWPNESMTDGQIRRASLNSFGFGGANAHAVVENTPSSPHTSSYKAITMDFFTTCERNNKEEKAPLRVLVFSANDQISLDKHMNRLTTHFVNPSVSIDTRDLAFTLSERRTAHYNRAFVVTDACNSTQLDIRALPVQYGKPAPSKPRIAFIFTGQGAQWPQMGMDLINTSKIAREMIIRMDEVLKNLRSPPKWNLLDELTSQRIMEDLRRPELSQPLLTALQLAIVKVLQDWGIEPKAVVGHSSGEIAAAVAAGLLTEEDAIVLAYYRGQACQGGESESSFSMLAVGMDEQKARLVIGNQNVEIACYNSPQSLTLAGPSNALEAIQKKVQELGFFARMLQVNMPYHSSFMMDRGRLYQELLADQWPVSSTARPGCAKMVSSVTADEIRDVRKIEYWSRNMLSPVLFTQALSKLLLQPDCPTWLVEIGPSGALAGPVSQIIRGYPGLDPDTHYAATMKRGKGSLGPLYDLAGQMYLSGGRVQLQKVNKCQDGLVVVDLPNYCWNHSTKYWHETQASKDWRFKPFIRHDLLGSKINGTSWSSPSFQQTLRLADITWLKDHRLGSQVVFPAAGYIAMAMEAVYQATSVTRWRGTIPRRYRYRLRDLKFVRALVLDEIETRYNLSLTPSNITQGWLRPWHEFSITSNSATGTQTHCTGFVCIETDYQPRIPAKDATRPLDFPASAQLWYKAMADSGYHYGPSFRKHLEVESTPNERSSRSVVSLEPPASTYGQSVYAIHPVCIDACFHTGVPAVWKGSLPPAGLVFVPAFLESMVIEATPNPASRGMALSSAHFLGVGDENNPRNYSTSCSLYDPSSGELLLEFRGLSAGGIDLKDDQAEAHNFTQLVWKPDIALLLSQPEPQIREVLLGNRLEPRLQIFFDLIAHSSPKLKILELSLQAGEAGSLWLQEPLRPMRTTCTQFTFCAGDTAAVVRAKQSLSEKIRNSQFGPFSLLSRGADGSGLTFDLVIIAASSDYLCSKASRGAVEEALMSLKHNGIGVGIGPVFPETITGVVEIEPDFCVYRRPKPAHINGDHLANPEIIHLSVLEDISVRSEQVHDTIRTALRDRGWCIRLCDDVQTIQPQQKVLVTDEMTASVISHPSAQQWDTLQLLVRRECSILWVTQGAYGKTLNPNVATINGLFRTIRAEEGLRLLTLDVEHTTGETTASAIASCLGVLCQEDCQPNIEVDSEYVERGGIIHICRLVPNPKLTSLQTDDPAFHQMTTVDLHKTEVMSRLGVEQLGNVDSIHWAQVASHTSDSSIAGVEVEIYASGLNYKDVVVTMGIVPGDEHMLGGEAAGVVTKVPSGTSQLKVGDRVVVYGRGCLANRVLTTPGRVHKIPAWMTYEEAATLCIVYMTAIHSLFRLSSLASGKTVLIHSATGGVGIAAIHIAQSVNAEIFVTVGTEEKRSFLRREFGIRDDHIFNSRNPDFAADILTATKNKGVDIILNSLTGDMLDESFRILADRGIMVEIGKKDILAHNRLTMDPFDRNITFSSVDMSYERTPESLVTRLLSEIFDLIERGCIQPIRPIHTFSYTDVPSAVRFLRAGKHMGKVVISDGPKPEITVPVRLANPPISLNPSACYLIVGGLKGLCGSLAAYLALKGAKFLAVISRTGYEDDVSRRVIKDIRAASTHIDLLTADITDPVAVKTAFRLASRPIAGIIQGAMVLRDRPFHSMSVEEYHEATACKIAGTWNLHNAASELKLNIEFFTLLSSVSGVTGSRGQANYAAANVFLDAFAVYRRSIGEPACSVALGIVEDSGFLSDKQGFIQKHFDNRVFFGLNDHLLRRIFYVSVVQQIEKPPVCDELSSQLITGITTSQPMDSILNRDIRFSSIFGNSSNKTTRDHMAGYTTTVDIQALLLLLQDNSADQSTKTEAAVAILSRELMRMLRLSSPIDSDRPLGLYGIDSLAAVEVRNWVRSELGLQISSLDIINATSLRALCQKVVSKSEGS